MQFAQKPFGSQNAMKQLYRQYSTTFKNTELQKNATMTQSSNLPFDKFYNAFNSTGHIKNFTLDRFKHSQAKSIIEKLMKTKQFSKNSQNNDIAILNELHNLQPIEQKGPIPLSKTQHKIFNEVANLITEIQDIKEKTHAEHEQFIKLKVELKKQGIQFPQIDEKKTESTHETFKRYSNQQLQNILDSNDKMYAQIEAITKELTNINTNQQSHSQTVFKSYAKKNSLLKKELSNMKQQIMNAGEIDDHDIFQMNSRIDELKNLIFKMEQKRMGRLTDADDQLKFLKDQNEALRLRTIVLLRKPSQIFSQRKSEAIRVLRFEEQEKISHFEKMNFLKNRYETLLNENSRLRNDSLHYGSPHYEGQLQVESKVSPFQNNLGEYRSVYGNGKENYLSNYENEKERRSPYISHEENVFKSRNESSGGYFYN